MHRLSIIASMIAMIISLSSAYAQEPEEIMVQFSVPDVGSVLIPALTNGSQVYLPVPDVFAFLHIRIDTLEAGSVIKGFIGSESDTYSIDPMERVILFSGKMHRVDSTALIVSEGRVYLRNDLFGDIFGLYCSFEFRDLEVRLRTTIELPAIREMKRERARNALRRDASTPRYDRSIQPPSAFVKPGVADWQTGVNTDNTGAVTGRYSLGVGTEVLGAAFDLKLSGSPDSLPSPKDITWQWRFVDNEMNAVRQISVGNIGSPLPDPFRGRSLAASVSNRSTVRRTLYGTYPIEGVTEPLWDVELYADGRLIDYTRADSGGMYRFDIPVAYGSTEITLKFYGPWGEERSASRTVRIPHSFLPSGTIEYTATTGLTEREGGPALSPFAHIITQIGLGSFATVGGGAGIVHTTGTAAAFPFVQGSFRPDNWLLLSGSYFYGLGGDAVLSIIPGRSTSIDLGYTARRFSLDPSVTGSLHRATVSLNTILDLPLLRGGLFCTASDNIDDSTHMVTGQGTFTTSLLGMPCALVVNTSLEYRNRFTVSALSGEARFSCNPFGLGLVRPSIAINLQSLRIAGCGLEFSRSITTGIQADIKLSYDARLRNSSVQIGIGIVLPFMRTTLGGRMGAGTWNAFAGSSGSVSLDQFDGTILTSNRNGLHRASLTIRPFLDLNNNGLRDPGEPPVADVDLMINVGIVRRSGDTVLRVLDLDPYTPVTVTVDDSHLKNVTWRTRYKTWSIVPGANKFEAIDVPIVVSADVSGRIIRERTDGNVGMKGLLLKLRNEEGAITDSIIAQEDGEFYFSGLMPGRYTIEPDAGQLRSLNLTVLKTGTLEVRGGVDGDIIEGVEVRVR